MAKKPKIKNLKAAQYAGIGRAIQKWAALEYRLIEALRSLLGIPTTDAAVIFWHMSYSEKRDRLTALFALKNPDEKLKKHFNSLVGRLDDAYDLRNTLAHSVWSPGKTKDTITPFVLRAKGGQIKVSGHDIKQEDFSAARLKIESEKIERLRDDFIAFFEIHFAADFQTVTMRKQITERR